MGACVSECEGAKKPKKGGGIKVRMGKITTKGRGGVGGVEVVS